MTYEELFTTLNLWFDKTIPQEAESVVEKVEEESIEFSMDPSAEEAADVIMALVYWAHLSGVDLKAAIVAKFEKNMGRKWERRPNGTWHHVKQKS